MEQGEIFLHWVTVVIYAISTVVFVYSMAFKKLNFEVKATWLAGFGLLVHTAALTLRWMVAGHGPYMRRYEVFSSNVWILVVMFLLIQYWHPSLRMLGSLVMSASLLMIGMAVMASPEIRPLPDTFQTLWLFVHIFFAKMTYGTAIIGTGLGFLYILRERYVGGTEQNLFLSRLPGLGVLDDLSYSFIAFSFLVNGVMIASGSIWANRAWGSYWSWDSVETWSLIAWIIYGIYLHLRKTYGWKGQRAAWFSVFALLTLIFALFGSGIFYNSSHSPYISG
ncbi:MAG: cytochrome c biogenesis protein CcsA [Thermincolia bacterium]